MVVFISIAGKSAVFASGAETELEAVRAFDNSPIGFSTRRAQCFADIHDYFIKRNSKWYIESTLSTPRYTTKKSGRFTITTFPIYPGI